MAFSKHITYFKHLRMLVSRNPLFHHPPPSIITLRQLSFATPEEAAAERRRRKRRLRIEPPLSSLNRSQQPAQQPIPRPIQNPNAPKLPEPVSALSGKRLELHNKILTLIRENDLEEAALYTRHSVYSNCRPTIFTVNAVLNAQLRQCKYADLLSLHRFITQAGIAPNIITYNLVFQTYLDCRKSDTAMELYKQFSNDSPLNASPTTYRIMVKGLVDNGKLERALELKDEMVEKGLSPDSIVYSYLMWGLAKNEDPDGVLRLYEELKEKKGGSVEDGVVYGPLMKGYFLKGMQEDAMRCYEEACGKNSQVKMTVMAYNYVLDALIKDGKFDMALELFERMKPQHNPPTKLVVNLGTFNVMVDGYCGEGRFKDAIEVFRSRNDYGCSADTLSYNNLIEQLCRNGMVAEAEQLCSEMSDHGVKPDEFTYVLLMDTCIKEDRLDDGAGYFKTMVDCGLRPNLAVYNRLVNELVKVGKVDEAKSFYDMMVKKLKMDNESYKFMMKAMSDVGKLDEVMKMADEILDDEGSEFNQELQEFVKGELKKEGREDDLTKLMEEKERLKAEAKAMELEKAEAAKRSAREAVASLIPSKLFGNKDAESESAASAETSPEVSSAGALEAAEEAVEEGTILEAAAASSDQIDSVNDGATVSATA